MNHTFLKQNFITEFHIKVPSTILESPSLFSSTLYTYNTQSTWQNLKTRATEQFHIILTMCFNYSFKEACYTSWLHSS